MSNENNACRLCSTPHDNRNKVKYGTRHYAHWDCGLRRFGKVDFLDMLPLHVVEQAPFFPLHDAGWTLDDIVSYIKRRTDAGQTAPIK
jgi:hypothetical protein